MKKNVGYFFAIIAMVAFFSSCERDEKNSTLVSSRWTHQDSLDVKTAIKRTVDSILSVQRKLDFLTQTIDADLLRSEVLVNKLAHLQSRRPRPHRQYNVNSITPTKAGIEYWLDMERNRNKPEEYRVKCDSDCISDHEWPITEISESHLAYPEVPGTTMKPFSFHNIVTDDTDSIKFDRVYAGVLLRSNHLFKSGEDYTHMSGRVAFSLSSHPAEYRWMNFEGWLFVDVAHTGTMNSGLMIKYDLKPTKWGTVSLGWIPQIASISKPDAISELGQNEKFTEDLLPTNTIGMSANAHINIGENEGTVDLKAGAFLEGYNHYSFQVGGVISGDGHTLETATWLYHLGDGNIPGIGWTTKYACPWFNALVVLKGGYYNGENSPSEPMIIGNMIKVPLRLTNMKLLKNVEFVSDVILKENHWTHFEQGLEWKFMTKYIGGSLGVTVDPYNNSLNTRILVHTR